MRSCFDHDYSRDSSLAHVTSQCVSVQRVRCSGRPFAINKGSTYLSRIKRCICTLVLNDGNPRRGDKSAVYLWSRSQFCRSNLSLIWQTICNHATVALTHNFKPSFVTKQHFCSHSPTWSPGGCWKICTTTASTLQTVEDWPALAGLILTCPIYKHYQHNSRCGHCCSIPTLSSCVDTTIWVVGKKVPGYTLE
jgi:hypothetical protein